jgi:glycosyltransferase involved in cell wall biosynthesis
MNRMDVEAIVSSRVKSTDLGMHRSEPSDGEQQARQVRPIALGPLPDHPLVSILISSYNYARYLTDAIESSLGQTYDNLEVVICDDGSTDDSVDILKGYQLNDGRVKVIFQDTVGQAGALGAAFSQSSGEIICLLDSDDVFTPDKVRRVVQAFSSARDSGLAVNQMLRVDSARNYLGEIPLLFPLASGWLAPSLIFRAPQLAPGLPPSSGLSLRRAVGEAIFPLPSNLKIGADTWIQILVPLITPIVAIEVPLSEYRVHGANANATVTFTEDKLRTWAILEREVWNAWRNLLVSPRSPLSHLPLLNETAPSFMSYAYERFRSGSGSKTKLVPISSECLRRLSGCYRWYWRAVAWMPDWLFRWSFTFVYGQTRAKMTLGRIRAALRHAVLRESHGVAR